MIKVTASLAIKTYRYPTDDNPEGALLPVAGFPRVAFAESDSVSVHRLIASVVYAVILGIDTHRGPAGKGDVELTVAVDGETRYHLTATGSRVGGLARALADEVLDLDSEAQTAAFDALQ